MSEIKKADASGNVIYTQNEDGENFRKYDENGREIYCYYSDGSGHFSEYDAQGRLSIKVNFDLSVPTYDGSGEWNSRAYEYDNAGNLLGERYVTVPYSSYQERIKSYNAEIKAQAEQQQPSQKQLNKARQALVDRMLSRLDAGAIPWDNGMKGFAAPRNAVSGKHYRGINLLNLMLAGKDDPRWLTFNQATDAGYKVKKGAHGVPIELYKIIDKRTKKDADFAVIKEEIKDMTFDERQAFKRENLQLFARTYYVFNASDVAGIEPYRAPILTPTDISARNERIEAVIAASAAPIFYDGRGRNYYSPDDTIHLTERAAFTSDEFFYNTALHEMAHSTGHSSRLNRNMVGIKGSPEYAREELVAEMASVLIAAEFGLNHSDRVIENSAEYVRGWAQLIRDNPQTLIDAAFDASKATDYICDSERQRTQTQEKTQKESLQSGVKEWYTRTFSSDELASELNANATFGSVRDAIMSGKDIYTELGSADSVVRERVFRQLADVLDISYKAVYNAWIENSESAETRQERYERVMREDFPKDFADDFDELTPSESKTHTTQTVQLRMTEAEEKVFNDFLAGWNDGVSTEKQIYDFGDERPQSEDFWKGLAMLGEVERTDMSFSVRFDRERAHSFTIINDLHDSQKESLQLTDNGSPMRAIFTFHSDGINPSIIAGFARDRGMTTAVFRNTDGYGRFENLAFGKTPLNEDVWLERLLHIYNSDNSSYLCESTAETAFNPEGDDYVNSISGIHRLIAYCASQEEFEALREHIKANVPGNDLLGISTEAESPDRALLVHEINADKARAIVTALDMSVQSEKTQKEKTQPAKQQPAPAATLKTNLDNIPDAMKALPNWVAFRTETTEGGKVKKMLLSPNKGASSVEYLKWAKSDDPTTWATFDKAVAFAKKYKLDGLAFAMGGSGMTCIDLDHHIDENGKPSELAQKYINAAQGTYIERSVSGRGLHIFYAGARPNGHLNRNIELDLETYDSVRFMSMTGNLYGNAPKVVAPPSSELTNLLKSNLGKLQQYRAPSTPLGMDDNALIEKIRSSSRRADFDALWRGELILTKEDGKGDPSRCDYMLCNILGFFSGGDVAQVERLIKSSGLYRPEKPDKYYAMTSRKACDGLRKVYTPAPKSNGTKKNGWKPNGNGGTGSSGRGSSGR